MHTDSAEFLKKKTGANIPASSIETEKSVEMLCKHKGLGMMDAVTARKGKTQREFVDGGVLSEWQSRFPIV